MPAYFFNTSALVKRYVPSPAAGPVLVVEDDAPTRALRGRALSKAGWAVEDAENGRVALERIEASRPALVLLDLMMPEMDGFEFLDVLRRDVARRDIPVVVITAKTLTDGTLASPIVAGWSLIANGPISVFPSTCGGK